MSVRRIIGVGAGGHCRSVLDALLSTNEWSVVGLLDPDRSLWGTQILGITVLGDDSKMPELRAAGIDAAFIGVGGVGDNGPRASIYQRLLDNGFELPSVLHSSAIVAPSVSIGAGTVILAGAIVNAEARLGSDVIVNTGAIVEHECVIGDHCHLGPGNRLGGRVHVGRGAHVGMGAIVLQGLTIGERAVVGAGAVVLENVPPLTVVVGIPARPVKQRA